MGASITRLDSAGDNRIIHWQEEAMLAKPCWCRAVPFCGLSSLRGHLFLG